MTVLEWRSLVERLLRITTDLQLRLFLSGQLEERALVEQMLPEHARLVGAVDHETLFPRCCAVVHHGCAGSTATGLRAGRPTMVCAVLGDQPFFGRMVTRQGLGSWAPLRGLTEAKLRAGISTLLEPTVIERARVLGEQMRAERPGAEVAVDALAAPDGAGRGRRVASGSGRRSRWPPDFYRTHGGEEVSRQVGSVVGWCGERQHSRRNASDSCVGERLRCAPGRMTWSAETHLGLLGRSSRADARPGDGEHLRRGAGSAPDRVAPSHRSSRPSRDCWACLRVEIWRTTPSPRLALVPLGRYGPR